MLDHMHWVDLVKASLQYLYKLIYILEIYVFDWNVGFHLRKRIYFKVRYGITKFVMFCIMSFSGEIVYVTL